MHTTRKSVFGFIAKVAAATLIAFSFAAGSAYAQQKAKRKFGPGQNAAPVGVRPPAQRAVPRPQPPKRDIIATHGKWIVQCDPKKPAKAGAKESKRACAIIQTVVHEKNKAIGLTLVLARGKQGKDIATIVNIFAPIGVYLPTGIALEVDGAAAGRVPFTRCTPQSCLAFAQFRKETLAKMKKGSKGKFLIYEAPGIGIPLNLDLTGFTAAIKDLDKVQQ